jgi:hypothetical protein
MRARSISRVLADAERDTWSRLERSAEHRQRTDSVPESACVASAWCGLSKHPRVVLRRLNVFDLAQAEAAYRCPVRGCGKADPWARPESDIAKRRTARGQRV